MLTVIPQHWESAFFGRPIAQVQWDAPPNANRREYDLIQAKVPCHYRQRIAQLQRQGFILVEGEAQFCLALSLSNVRFSDYLVADEHAIPTLEALCENAFPHSRFREPYFRHEEQQRFYRYWIRQAVKGQFDDICLIEQAGERICGTISLKKQGDQVRIGLLAVDPAYHRQGIATRLFQYAQQWAIEQNAQTLWVSTQFSNQAAIRFYQAQNAKWVQSFYWFYA